MNKRNLFSSCLVIVLAASAASAQDAAPAPAKSPAPHHAQAAPAAQGAVAAPAPNERDVAETQHKLIELLRISPTLTTVIARDPSLLANHDYVSRNNPQLAAFLDAHPEVARNPDFYLFTHLNHQDGSPDEALERAVWPDVYRSHGPHTGFDSFVGDALGPLMAFGAFLIAIVWGTRMFVENRRWSRVFKLQSEVHAKLIEKFGSSQELAAYMETDAGRRFLEAAPITVDAPSQRMPNAVSRILLPLQLGTVLILLGLGFLSLRHIGPEYEVPMRIIGTLILMPGIGFILSAGLTWLMAARLGLLKMAQPHADVYDAGGLSRRQG
jgi:hypothetical protein